MTTKPLPLEPGRRVRFIGQQRPGQPHPYFGRTAVVVRQIKTERMYLLRWDEPPGPLASDKTYRAFAGNVEPVDGEPAAAQPAPPAPKPCPRPFLTQPARIYEILHDRGWSRVMVNVPQGREFGPAWGTYPMVRVTDHSGRQDFTVTRGTLASMLWQNRGRVMKLHAGTTLAEWKRRH